MRRAKVDDNQAEVVDAIRRKDGLVLHLHTLGKGAPDILVGYHGRLMMFEIKDGNKPPSRRRLTPDEERFHALWAGMVHVVSSPDEALEVMYSEAQR